MSALRLVLVLGASVPAAWIALVWAERVPVAQSLVNPRPRFPFPRGLSVLDGLVYPLTAVLFVLTALRIDEAGYLAVYLGAFTVLVALSVIDLETLRLPDLLVLPTTLVLALVVLVDAIAGGAGNAGGAVAGAGVYFGFLLLAHLVSPAGMGFGDVKLALSMGLLVGWPSAGIIEAVSLVLWAMLGGFAVGSIVGVVMLVVRGRSAAYPFGPFLVLGAVAVVLVAPSLLPSGAQLGF